MEVKEGVRRFIVANVFVPEGFGLGASFVVTNAASAIAFVKLLRGERKVRWQARKGA